MTFIKIVKKTFGIIFAVISGLMLVGAIIGIVIREFDMAITFAVICAIFGIPSFLLSKKSLKQNKKNYNKLQNNISVATEYIPDYPVFPNQDTDIPADSYIFDEKRNIIARTDGNPINDADAAYLVRNGLESAMSIERNSSNPKFHRSEKDKEFIFQFLCKYGDQSEKICAVFDDLYGKALKTKTAEERLVLLRQAADAFDIAKKWHYDHSRGAMLWFQDMWEYQHNSRIESFSWIDGVLEQIVYTEKEIYFITPWIMENAKTGFLQTKIYKAFPDENKAVLRKIITVLEEQGKLQKSKKGNSYYIVATA